MTRVTMIAAVGVPATGLQATRETMSARRIARAVAGLGNFILERGAGLELLDNFVLICT